MFVHGKTISKAEQEDFVLTPQKIAAQQSVITSSLNITCKIDGLITNLKYLG